MPSKNSAGIGNGVHAALGAGASPLLVGVLQTAAHGLADGYSSYMDGGDFATGVMMGASSSLISAGVKHFSIGQTFFTRFALTSLSGGITSGVISEVQGQGFLKGFALGTTIGALNHMGAELMEQIVETEQAKQAAATRETRYGISLKNGLSNYGKRNYLPLPETGLRLPDFITVTVSISLPNQLTGAYFGWNGTFTADRHGQIFFSPIGFQFGKSPTMFAGSITANWMLQNTMPSAKQTYNFLSGHGISAGAGYIGGISYSRSPTNLGVKNALGIGIFSPQAGASYNWTPDKFIYHKK